MRYASISVSYSGYYCGCAVDDGEDGKPSKSSLTLSGVEYVLNTAAQELGIRMFHEYSWPDSSCYKVIAAEDIKVAVEALEAAIIEAAPKLTHIGEVEIPSFTINGVNIERELLPDSIQFDWRGDERTIKEIFDGVGVPPSPPDTRNRKQRRADAAIARDSRIVRDPKE